MKRQHYHHALDHITYTNGETKKFGIQIICIT